MAGCDEKRYNKGIGGRVEINQPNSVSVYNKTTEGVNHLNHNISSYMIHLCT